MTNSVGNAVVHDPDFDWGDDHFEMPGWNELRHLRAARRHVQRPEPDDDKPGTFADAEKRLDHLKKLGVNASRSCRSAEFAGRPLVGLQPGPHLRRRERLRRPEGVQGVRQGGPPPRVRGHPRRGLQPLRPRRPRPVAVRRLERERRRRHLLLQRLAGRDARGATPAPTTAAARSASSSATTP